MASSIDAYVGAKETVVADGDHSFVKDREVEVGKEPLSQADMLAVVAVERLVDESVGICLSEHLPEHGVTCGKVGGQQVVIPLAEHLDGIEFG